MSRFILGDCVRVMATLPDNAVDVILTDPPYLVGFRDRSGRSIAGDKTDEWLQPACNQMYRVLKKDALMVSFYGWNRVDRFMAAWESAGFSVVGHLVFTKTYSSKSAYVGYRHECAYIPSQFISECSIDWDFVAAYKQAEKEGREAAFISWAEYTGECDYDAFDDAYRGEAESEEAWAQEMVEDNGLLNEVPEPLRSYFDFEAYARDLFSSGYVFHDGYVFSN
ncbi:hypothetical protein JJ33_24715 [Salmonella enterica subsp. enterica]|nr:hypothetical protein [Salmonella enterica subsp. enterica]EGI6283833.1 hypothetical protein [Salmonella enterica subsp. enterica serovar Telhashomer]